MTAILRGAASILSKGIQSSPARLSLITARRSGWTKETFEEKSHKNVDPTLIRLRIRCMYLETEALTLPRDTARGAVCDAVKSAALQRGSKRAKLRSVDRSDSQEAHWVACMRRVSLEKDKQAFAELFAHFAPRVKAFLMKSGAQASLAEECSQDVMATVWRKSELFDPSRASLATWIFTIARNRRIDTLRKERRPEPEDLAWGPEAEPDQADVMTLQQESARLVEAIAELPEKQRSLIEQAYFGDLTHSEIAEVTGLPLGTIKSRIRLALDRLRHKLA